MHRRLIKKSVAVVASIAAVAISASALAADLALVNARVYTLSWGEPDKEGAPAGDAPYRDGLWTPDGDVVIIEDGLIRAVGKRSELKALINKSDRVIDLGGAVLIPGLVESHGHFPELGELAELLDVTGVSTMEEMAALVRAEAETAPDGEWIVGGGWDEGEWADNLPTHDLLTQAAPDNPVILKGRRGFGVVGNARAMELAGLDRDTPTPSGGEIVKDENGDPTGVLLNRAQGILRDAPPTPTLEDKKRIALHGLNAIAKAGYVSGHHAGVNADYMAAYEALAQENTLPVRLEAMVAAREGNRALAEKWIEEGPTTDRTQRLQVRSFKAYYDGSLGSRGARMIEDYADQPGHTGTSGAEYGFPEDMVEAAMKAGFQVGAHAIGDLGNRETLDFFENVFARHPETKSLRHRIEHAQIVHSDDFARFGTLNIVASMEPCHAVEDSPWAEDRVGKDRIKGGYAWRSLRRNGAGIIFNSDLSGTDFDIFYGLHCAITRTDRAGAPKGGWYSEEALTPEESLRAFTVWPAYASMREDVTGAIEAGKWADLTVLSIDPLNVGEQRPHDLLHGQALMTIVGGEIVHNALPVKEGAQQ